MPIWAPTAEHDALAHSCIPLDAAAGDAGSQDSPLAAPALRVALQVAAQGQQGGQAGLGCDQGAAAGRVNQQHRQGAKGKGLHGKPSGLQVGGGGGGQVRAACRALTREQKADARTSPSPAAVQLTAVQVSRPLTSFHDHGFKGNSAEAALTCSFSLSDSRGVALSTRSLPPLDARAAAASSGGRSGITIIFMEPSSTLSSAGMTCSTGEALRALVHITVDCAEVGRAQESQAARTQLPGLGRIAQQNIA